MEVIAYIMATLIVIAIFFWKPGSDDIFNGISNILILQLLEKHSSGLTRKQIHAMAVDLEPALFPDVIDNDLEYMEKMRYVRITRAKLEPLYFIDKLGTQLLHSDQKDPQ